MAKKLHFMLTSERGKTFSLSITTRTIKSISLVMALVLTGCVAGWGLSVENVALRARTMALKHELTGIKEKNRGILAKAARQELEQKALLDTALAELKQRSEVIESILSAVGVDVEISESRSNAGGPYTRQPEDSFENLTFKVDHYLETIQSVPLGSPVAGVVSSLFGKRQDPINGQAAFHSGVDIRNERGTRVKATADGVVVQRGYTRGHGNFVVVDHGNHFATRYLHLQKSLVKVGEVVKRGQAIALLGNTGRSTGPHLHYEINYQERALNPLKFMHIASVMNERGVSREKAAH